MARSQPLAGDTEGPQEGVNIGKLAEEVGVSTRTIRYYEELGVLPEPPRSSGNTRKYPPEFKFYLESVLTLKDIGFSLEELQLLSRLYLGTQGPLSRDEREQAMEVVAGQLETLREKIDILNRVRKILERNQPARIHDLADLPERARS